MWFGQLGERVFMSAGAVSLLAEDDALTNALCVVYGDRYHKSQAIYLESKDNTKISCVISSVGTNEVSCRSHQLPVNS